MLPKVEIIIGESCPFFDRPFEDRGWKREICSAHKRKVKSKCTVDLTQGS